VSASYLQNIEDAYKKTFIPEMRLANQIALSIESLSKKCVMILKSLQIEANKTT